MPYSYSLFKEEVEQHLLSVVNKDFKVLDVGPGSGTYGRMLKDLCHLDAVEIYEPYIHQFNLKDLYDNVFLEDICKFDIHPYNYLILGDVLEHLTLDNAIPLIDKINALGKKCLIAVPYLYEQGEEYGNIHETHHQPDLTYNKMASRYPSLKLLYGDDKYGYYVNY
jgi:hypothetical protein